MLRMKLDLKLAFACPNSARANPYANAATNALFIIGNIGKTLSAVKVFKLNALNCASGASGHAHFAISAACTAKAPVFFVQCIHRAYFAAS